jgi:hypothetical protein
MPEQNLFFRLLHHNGAAVGVPASGAQEPCLGCGEETAVGSIFYSDRRSVARAEGTTSYLCSECQVRAHRARKGQPLSDENILIIADNGMMIGAGFLTGGL